MKHQGILKGSIVLLYTRSVTMLLGFTLFVALVAKFGISQATDAFFVAQSITLFIVKVIEGALGSTFTPVFIDNRENKGEKEAWTIANTLFLLIFLIFGILSLIIALKASFLTYILAPGFSVEVRSTTIQLIEIMAPIMLISILSAFLSSIFFSYQHYTLPSLASLLPSIGAVLGIFLLTDEFGIFGIPLGLLAASTLQLVILIGALLPRSLLALNISISHPGVRQIGKLIVPRILNLSLTRIDILVDRFFASFFGTGAVSILTYAQKIINALPMLILGPLGKAILPALSKYNTLGNVEAIRTFISRTLRIIGFIVIPVTALIFIMGGQLVELILQRGLYDQRLLSLTTSVLLFYNVGLIAYCLNAALRTSFFSLRDTVTPLKIAIFSSLLNITLDLILIQFLALRGLALATALVAIMKTPLLFILLRRKIKRLDEYRIVSSITKMGISAVCAWLILKGVLLLFGKSFELEINLTIIGTILFIWFLIYIATCGILKVPEYQKIYCFIQKKVFSRGS